MAVPTRIKFADFFKAVPLLAVEKGYTCVPYKGKKASAICFQFFKKGEEIPAYIFCVHEDKHTKVIYSDDLKKPCTFLGITKKEFEEYVNNGFKWEK